MVENPDTCHSSATVAPQANSTAARRKARNGIAPLRSTAVAGGGAGSLRTSLDDITTDGRRGARNQPVRSRLTAKRRPVAGSSTSVRGIVDVWGVRLGERRDPEDRAVLQSVATLGICIEEAPAVTRPPGTGGLRAGPAS